MCKAKITKCTKNSHEIIESYKDELSPRTLETSQEQYISQINEFNNFIKTLDFKNYTSVAVIEMDDGCCIQFRSHTGKPSQYLYFKGDEKLSKSYVNYCTGNFKRMALESLRKQVDEYEAKYVGK
jgi:hypothetical protein